MCSSNYKFFDCVLVNGEREMIEVECGDANLDGQIREFHDEVRNYCEMNNGVRDCDNPVSTFDFD